MSNNSNNSKTNNSNSNSNYKAFIETLKTPTTSPEIETAKQAVEEATSRLKDVATTGDVAAIMAASSDVAARTAELEKIRARFKPAARTSAEIACNLIFEQGFRMREERGAIDYMARAVVKIMQDATGTTIAVPATRTTCSALLHALKTGRITQPEETEAARELAGLLSNQQ